MPDQNDRRCHCIIYHPERGTPAHQRVIENLRYFRSIDDSQGTMLALAQLCSCPSKTSEETKTC